MIAACHTESLAAHFGRRVRRLVLEHGAAREDGLARDDRAAGRFATTRGASYFAAGVRGPLMGRRAELIVIDDPIKSTAEAESAAACATRCGTGIAADLTTRLTPGGKIVLVMTRWHEDDLAGRLLANGDRWQALRLPALAEDGRPAWAARRASRCGRNGRTRRAGAATARGRAARLGGALSAGAAHRDRRRCSRPAGSASLEAEPACRRIVRAWDLAATAAGEGRDPDWTAGIKVGRTEAGGFVVLDVRRLRGGPYEVAEAILQTARLDGRDVQVGLPQDPGQAGKQQVAWLTGLLAGFRVTAGPETGPS